MIKNNLKICLRHLIFNRTNTVINCAGLILGLGIVSVIVVFLLNETGYNSSFTNSNRIYRILNYSGTDQQLWANTPFVTGKSVCGAFAEVEAFAHQYQIVNVEIKKGGEFIPEPHLLCTESSFFSVFTVKILQGSMSKLDESANTLLLSKQTAAKYFANQNPIGQTLVLRYSNTEYPMEVIGVYDDIPQNSSIKASIIAGNAFGFKHIAQNVISTGETKPKETEFRDSWAFGCFHTNYLLLKKNTSVAAFEKKLHQYGLEHTKEDYKMDLSLQCLSDIYFGSGKITDNNSVDKGNLSMLYVLVFVGLIILIVAGINYLNLTTAQVLSQTQGYAVRRVCGAQRRNLIMQMIMESSLVSILSLPFALALANISMPFVSQMLGKTYILSLSHRFFLCIALLVLITLLTAMLTGFLVSLQVTSVNIVQAIKEKSVSAGKSSGLRKTLVVFQIAVFIALIAIMVLVQKQVHYSLNKDLGFNKVGLIRIPIGDHNYALYKQEISKNPNVIGVSAALWLPPHKAKMNISIPKVDEPQKQVVVKGMFVDYHFASTMGLNVLQGFDFDEVRNKSGVLVNETAIKALGLKQVIGEQTAFGRITGVVSDFNMYSVHEKISPTIIKLEPSMCHEMAVRLKTDNLPQTIGFLRSAWKATGGVTPFDFDFTDDILKQIYDSDIRFSKTISLLSLIAVLIASLGLFGLSLFICRQKTKEIGIRKVNGAKISEILLILNSDFVKWVSIAFIIACPVAWYAMDKWLQNFAYKTELSWWIFPAAGFIALGIAILTVSWQSWRAATRNPIESLRYE
jgi:putative ABC transport system permease protein